MAGGQVNARNAIARLAGILACAALVAACGDEGDRRTRGDASGEPDGGAGGAGDSVRDPRVGSVRQDLPRPGHAQGGNGKGGKGHGNKEPHCERTLKAQVVALDQVYTYNRFGSFNPYGMIYALKRDVVASDGGQPGPGNAMLREDKRPRPLVLRMNVGDCLDVEFTNWLAVHRDEIVGPPEPPDPEHPDGPGGDSPFTRRASFHVNGLHPLDIVSDASNVGRNPDGLTAPGQTRTYRLYADREGTYLAYSMGAIAGGEGDGGSLVQGLFGAVNVQPRGSSWYRSQVTAAQLAKATKGKNPDGTPKIDYEARDEYGKPILRILDANYEIVHSDLTAIVAGYRETEFGTSIAPDQGAYREMTVIFHDELKAVQAFPELEDGGPHDEVRDGNGINYGASGIGAILLANRKRMGPSKDCVECAFEEFFLTSWANGDPAMNVAHDGEGKARALYPDDPSNVWHSYLGDPMRIRNIHAGPGETHVFHLHAHQWLQEPGADNDAYLDSQTISPGSTFTYNINFGGSGNRNYAPGDAIFHCHFYPHFATGMWGLWRVHDTFEAGTPDRNLPDGEIEDGTPTPAVVPLPKFAMPPMPTYVATKVETKGGKKVLRKAMPGYPHYIAAIAGRRPSQPPLDMAFDGGLPRHVITSVPEATLGERGEFDVHLERANVKLLPHDGTPEERAAMDFHAGRFPDSPDVPVADDGFPGAGYKSYTPEGKKSVFYVNGRAPQPGAPYADPCPDGAVQRTLRIATIQMNLIVNTEGWHDPQGRIQVFEEDAEATLAGRRLPEPLVMRAHSGECVVLESTNLIPDVLEEDDFQIFTPTDTIGNHIHLVKFDVTSSDGSGNGWNYEDGTFAAETVRARIEAANAAGGALAADGRVDETGQRKRLAPKPHPRLTWAPLGTQTSVQRWHADPITNSTGLDRTVTTAFTHDHFSPSSHQQHGLYASISVQPVGSKWRNPFNGDEIGTRPDGGPAALQADILTANPASSYREINIAVADFALLYDAWGKPVNPPTFMEAALPIAIEHPEGVRNPETISAGDPGSMLINYRNEPIPLRIARRESNGRYVLKDGPEAAMENVFRSDIHGDPFTTTYQVYPGDRVEVRSIAGAHEEMHNLKISGVKWLRQPDDPDSGYQNAQPIGLSEHFEARFVVPSVAKDLDVLDLQYKSASTDDLWNGLWGLIRAYREEQPHLKTLPSNSEPGKRIALPSCPPQARIREYTVHAIAAKDHLPEGRLYYNERHGLYDPSAVLFVKAEHLGAIRKGARRPESLILRAAAGECVRVHLINDLPKKLDKLPHWNILPPITEHFNVNQVPMSSHVSMHPQLVQYDISRDDGASIGLNPVGTVAPGDRRTYEWYAGSFTARRVMYDERTCNEANVLTDDGERSMLVFDAVPMELGAVGLRSYGDVVNHGTHGASAMLVVEPEGAEWQIDPHNSAQATVSYVDRKGERVNFRELVLLYQDELALHSDDPRFQCVDDLNCGTALRPYGAADDAEDTGHKGFNHRSEPLWARLGIAPEVAPDEFNDLDLSNVLDSDEHGDPETPMLTARAGDELRIRIGQPSGHPRQHAFTLHGHAWEWNAWEKGSASTRLGRNSGSFQIGTVGGFGPGGVMNAVPSYGAGGPFEVEGDYLYRDQNSNQFPGGLWGIFRVAR